MVPASPVDCWPVIGWTANENKTVVTMDLQQQVRHEQTHLESVVAEALATARQLGADNAEVSISKQTGLSVNTRGGEVESIEFNKDGALGIAIYRDGVVR